MRLARIIALSLALAFPAVQAAAAGGGVTERVTVTAVRIFVNDIRYDWREDGPPPNRARGGFTEPATVASFLGVRPGEEMSAGELDRRRARASVRLAECGYFYSTQVLIVPVASRADGRLFVVKVTEGFLWRFGGGPYFATVGRDNALGASKSWNLSAGYNRDGFTWRDGAVNGGPIAYEIGLLYENSLDTGFLDYHSFSMPLSAGVRVTPDLVLTLGSPLAYRLIYAEASPAMELFPDTVDGLEWAPALSFDWETAVFPSGVRISLDADASAGLSLFSSGASHWRVAGAGAVSVATWPGIHLRTSAGAVLPINMGLPGFAFFDLANTPARAIRAGYDFLDILAARYAMASAELRFPLPRIPLGSIFSLSVTPFLYADAALARTARDGSLRDLEGFGLGARIGFENPIFAYFSLSYGWNPQGNGRFCFFAVSADW